MLCQTCSAYNDDEREFCFRCQNKLLGATFKKTGDRPIEFDVTYILQNTGADPKIIMFIAHQDEEKAMQELGLMSE